jgi:hypothetical protein
MSDPKADRYSIEIKNLTTGEVVILTTVDMTMTRGPVSCANYFGCLVHRQRYG